MLPSGAVGGGSDAVSLFVEPYEVGVVVESTLLGDSR